MKKYTITVTEKQAHEISRACEILARLRVGQFDAALMEFPIQDFPWDICRMLRSTIEPSRVSGSQVPWDLYQVIRHRLAWDSLKGDKRPICDVRFDEPMQRGAEPLATIVRVEG